MKYGLKYWLVLKLKLNTNLNKHNENIEILFMKLNNERNLPYKCFTSCKKLIILELLEHITQNRKHKYKNLFENTILREHCIIIVK